MLRCAMEADGAANTRPGAAGSAVLFRGLMRSEYWRKDWNRETRIWVQAVGVTERFSVFGQTTKPFVPHWVKQKVEKEGRRQKAE